MHTGGPAHEGRDRCTSKNGSTVSFSKTSKKSVNGRTIHCFVGAPDCSASYAWLLEKLLKVTSKWHAPTGPLTEGQRGNVGEFIAYLVARHDGLSGPGYTVALGGALTPLQVGTAPGMDVTIVHLAPDGDTSKDCLYVLEVKTTGQVVLTYASALVDDYAKLLDTTRPSTSLPARMSALKAKLALEHDFDDALLDRVEDLYRPKAADCDRIKLLPTLVHDKRYGDPVVTLDGVAGRILKQGWPSANLEPRSIALRRLNECLEHLVKKAKFSP